MGLDEAKMQKVADAYKKGKTEFTLSGKQYSFEGLKSLQVFTHQIELEPKEFEKRILSSGHAPKNLIGSYLSPEILATAGKNVTDKIIGDVGFGELTVNESEKTDLPHFVNLTRIIQLKEIQNENFDLSRLIKFCEELNENYQNGNYYSVAMLGRSILNHVPPVLGFRTFIEVANNYGNRSFKGNMSHLQNSMKNIADNYLHETIRRNEVLPTSNQVNFSPDLDVLLGEVIRKLKTK